MFCCRARVNGVAWKARELMSLDLLGFRLRYFVDEPVEIWNHVVGNAPRQKMPQRLRRDGLRDHDHRLDLLTHDLVWHAKHGAVFDGGMLEQLLLYLGGRNHFAPTAYQLFHAAVKIQIAILVQIAAIPGI